MNSFSEQFAILLLLGLPIACISWTVTHEELFAEFRDYCKGRGERCSSFAERKFFYLPTCEYCFSHYVAALFLIITGFKLIYPDWRGFLISFFALVWVANIYMSFFGRLRVELKKERVELKKDEQSLEASPNAKAGGDRP